MVFVFMWIMWWNVHQLFYLICSVKEMNQIIHQLKNCCKISLIYNYVCITNPYALIIAQLIRVPLPMPFLLGKTFHLVRGIVHSVHLVQLSYNRTWCIISPTSTYVDERDLNKFLSNWLVELNGMTPSREAILLLFSCGWAERWWRAEVRKEVRFFSYHFHKHSELAHVSEIC